MISGVAASCFGCKTLIAGNRLHTSDSKAQQKFLADSEMSYEQVFNFAFKNWYIRYMKGLEAEIGKEKFLEMLKKVGWTLYEESIKRNYANLKKRDVESLITNFWAPMQKSRLWSTHKEPLQSLCLFLEMVSLESVRAYHLKRAGRRVLHNRILISGWRRIRRSPRTHEENTGRNLDHRPRRGRQGHEKN